MNKNLLTLSIAFISFSAILLSGCDKEDPDAIQTDVVNKGLQLVTGADGKDYYVVDLGLPSGNLWATCNMGAASPELTGSLYAWGEKEPKQNFEWSNYLWNSDENVADLTKYCSTDGKTQLEAADQAPAYTMGQGWRIPSKDDFLELLTTRNCTSKWCKLNGIGGFLFTSVRKGYEGNSIFMPISGMKDHDVIRFEGQYGWYWCNSLFYDSEKQKTVYTEASALWFEHDDVDNHIIKSRPRSVGLPIRAIYVGK